MKKILTELAAAFLLILLWGIQPAAAQKATEVFIPVGQSPGLSGTYTTLGTCTSIDTEDHTFELTDSTGQPHKVVWTDSTQVWLDRSKMNKRNQYGSYEDLREGWLTEVKFDFRPDSSLKETADWIKIQVEN